MQMRAAEISDAKEIAYLANLAAAGIPYFCWKLSNPTLDPWSIGVEIVRRDVGDYSYKNCLLLVDGNNVAALLNSFRLTKADTLADIEALPPVLHPLVRLENKTVGNWYINTLATSEKFRKQGCAAKMLGQADELAKLAGAKKNSLLVRSGNAGARKLYEKFGFNSVAEEKAVPFEGNLVGEYWILMEKTL